MPSSIILRAPLMNAYNHQGVRGKQNDDRHDYFKIEVGGSGQPGRTVHIAIVADGVTSTDGGDQASEIAVNTIRKTLSQPNHANNLLQLLEGAITAANLEIWSTANEQLEHKNMSTTLVLAAIDGDTLYVLHLGDSRAYLVRNQKIYQLTLDHTWVQQAVDIGRLSKEKAKTHTNRHVIQNFMGIHSSIEIDRSIIKPGTGINVDKRRFVHDDRLALQENDMLLLCSDGLTDHVDDSQLLASMQQHRQQPRKAAQSLVQLALEQNEPDNITALVVDFSTSKQQTTLEQPPQGQDVSHSISGKHGRSTKQIPSAVGILFNFATQKVLITIASTLILLLLGGSIFTMMPSVSGGHTPREVAIASAETEIGAAIGEAGTTSTPTPVSVAVNNSTANNSAAATNPADTVLPTVKPQATQTRVVAATATAIPTNTATPTPTHTPIPTSTATPIPTNTPTPTNTATLIPTNTPTPTNTATPIPANTAAPIPVVAPPTAEQQNDPTLPEPILSVAPTPASNEPMHIWLEQDDKGYLIQPHIELEKTQRTLLSEGKCIELVIDQTENNENNLPETGKGKCDDPDKKPLRFSKDELSTGRNYISLWTMEPPTQTEKPRFLRQFSITLIKDVQGKPTATPKASTDFESGNDTKG